MLNTKSKQEQFEKTISKYVARHNPKKKLSPKQAAEGAYICYKNTNELLRDARLLAVNKRYSRSLSLTVLALEELGKIPALHQASLKNLANDSSFYWEIFWKEFGSHKPKQKRASAYGNTLKDNDSDLSGLENPTPYKSYFSDNTYGHLDRAKQQNFYVDFSGGAFVGPENDKDTQEILDHLFSFVSERADSFGSWHITSLRNIEYVLAWIKGPTSELFSINSWAENRSIRELSADALRLACYCSSGGIPDYSRFYPEMELVIASDKDNLIEIIRCVSNELNERIETANYLPSYAHRAFLMFKLCYGFAIKNIEENIVKDIFSPLNAG